MDLHRKVGTDSAEFRRQAELLAAARHPGVTELVGVEGSASRPVLVTVLIDGPTLAMSMPLTIEEVAGLTGALASTLADLHELGIVHGAVVPEHVLLAADGRPVLCGFGSAGRACEGLPDADDEMHPSRDVAALGRLLRRLATGPAARSLRRVADAATADVAVRPSAREVAAAVAAAVPGARLPAPRADAHDPALDLRALVAGTRSGRRPFGPRATTPRRLNARRDRGAAGEDGATVRAGIAPPSSRPRRPSLRSGALAGTIGAVVVVGLVLLAPWASPSTKDVRAPATTFATVTTGRPAVSTTVAPTTSAPPAARSDCPTPTAVLIADVDGDGCLDALRYADGVLEGAGVRWALGVAGDQIATGDWSCRGARTIVLLRPSSGEVFRFDGWAVGEHASVTGSEVATVPGGQAVRAADVDRDGCHELVVERGELPPQVVRLPRFAP